MNFTILQNFDIPIVGRSFLTSKNPEFFCISISPQKKPYLCPEHFFQVCKLVIYCESHVFGQMRQQFEIKFVNYILLQVYCRFRSNLSEQTLNQKNGSLIENFTQINQTSVFSFRYLIRFQFRVRPNHLVDFFQIFGDQGVGYPHQGLKLHIYYLKKSVF